MKSCTLRVVAVLLVAACSTGEVTEPPRPLESSTNPFTAIQDGANSGGNSDFFFLPPMVEDPSGNANYLNNGLNPSLSPTVTITTGSTTVLGPVVAPLSGDKYLLSWKVPVSATSKTYRVTIKLGTTTLGFADVFAAANSADLKNADNDVVALQDGRTLPIKFVIENFALCGTTGQATCATKTIDLTTGGTVTIPKGGVEIPAQGSGGSTTVTVSTCPDIPSDLPHFGSCIRVLTNPPIPDLTIPAEVWVCDSGIGAGASDQQKRVSMHRYDVPDTKALLHAHDQCTSSISQASWSLKGVFADLVNRRFESAGKQLKAMVGPRLLHAAVLDVGAGGLTDNFSDFQLLLPAKMTKCAGDGIAAAVGSVVAAKVCVSDLAGAPVQGATVHFATSDGSVLPLAVTTGANGEASASWTIKATPGSNSLVASGNGIASSTSNGPRAAFDPYQPFPYQGPPSPEAGPSSGAVDVFTASETFTVTGFAPSPLPVNYGSSGWSYQIDGTPPADWYSTAASPFSSLAPAPFGSANAGCALNNAGIATSWPASTSTFLYARRTFTLASPSQVKIGIAVDNDVQVFLDGVDISATNTQSVAPTGGLLIHDFCPTQDSFTFFTATLSAGPHIIAIRAKDRGTSAYFDASITVFIPIG